MMGLLTGQGELLRATCQALKMMPEITKTEIAQPNKAAKQRQTEKNAIFVLAKTDFDGDKRKPAIAFIRCCQALEQRIPRY